MAWYEKSFGEDYLLVYKHRNVQAATREVNEMMRWLTLPSQARVLDLCCGMGRHALTIADLGYRVHGIDLSDVLLGQARALDLEKRVEWLKADMRALPFTAASFDAVVNFFTSFGYFRDDHENQTVLFEMDRVLQVGGLFLIDFLNPTHVSKHLIPMSVRQEGALVIREHRYIEHGYVRKTIEIEGQSAPIRRYQEQVRLYELADFQRLLADTSLRITAVYGAVDGTPYEPHQSERMIMVGHKVSREEGE